MPEHATLESIIRDDGVFIDGDWVESKDQDPNGDVRLIQLADVGDGEYRSRSSRFLTSKKANEIGCTFLEAGDILVARMPDPLGRACIFPGDAKRAVTVVDVAIVRPRNPEVDTRWLMHRLNSPAFRATVSSLQSGSTRARISRKNLAGINFDLPPAERQREAVAEIEKQFSRLDEAVASLERAKANLARYKAAILKAAVEGRLVPTEASLSRLSGQPFESGADLVKRLRAKALGSEGSSKRPTSFDQSAVSSECAPEGWQQTPLCSVAEVQLGQQRAPVHAAAEEQIPYIRAANITWQGIDLSDVKAMGFQNLARYRLEYGDVLLSEASGSASEVGKPAIWRDEIPSACYQKTVLRVRSRDHEAVSPEFLHLTFLNACLSGAFRRLAPGVGILHLTAERMIEWPLLLPPGAEQRRIVAEVDRLMSIARATEAQLDTALARAARLRQSILSRAFSGGAV